MAYIFLRTVTGYCTVRTLAPKPYTLTVILKLMIPETPAPKSTVRIVEEVFNSVTHGVGTLLALAGLIFGLLTIAAPTIFMVGFIIYGASLMLLLTVSTLYHALSFSRASRVFLVLDHCSIFILIAGSYTPFVISLYEGWARIVILAVIWAIAIASIAVNASIPIVMNKASMLFYIGFGWMAVLLLPKLNELSSIVLWLVATGGVLYTVGAILMALKKPFFHLSWHMLVLAAATAHFFAVLQLT